MKIDEAQLENFLNDLGLISTKELQGDDLRRAQAYILGLSVVNLKDKKLDLATLSLIPEPIARLHNAVAFSAREGEVEVALLDIKDLPALKFLKEKGLKILLRLTDSESMKRALLSYQNLLRDEFGAMLRKEGVSLDALLRHAFLQGAKYIHIEPQVNEVLVRYRIAGILHEAMVLPIKIAKGITDTLKINAGLKSESTLLQEGRFKLEGEGEEISFRVTTLPTASGEKVVVRIISGNAEGFTLEGLGFYGSALEKIHEVLARQTGLVLVAGTEHSGRTTTLYTMLDVLNSPKLSLASAEDHVEHKMSYVAQAEARSELGFTIQDAIRGVLKQDPDVLMVGELRESESTHLVLSASERNILTLSAVQANSAAAVIQRILDMKVDPLQLASNLKMVIAQRLVGKLQEDKEKYFLNEEEIERLGNMIDLARMLMLLREEGVVGAKDGWDKIPFYKKKSEFVGKVGIQEVMVISPTIQHLIVNEGTAAAIEERARKDGMTTMLENGILKAARGLTTLDEVLKAF
ncbi:MAG: ATPase, T2SS/T4P/T4SS family [Candidatus Zambryskibacteria bacterium]|nr:ATPase, T2SS/T4P/T4SS family [Candidatus Zambryskibacteria bacterium]